MGRIDDALLTLAGIEDTTERAMQLAGLISTLFKLKGVVLIVTGQLAFDSYANAVSDKPELELATFSGDPAPRTVLEIMRGQLRSEGSLHHWEVADIPVRFLGEVTIIYRELCRDFVTDLGVVKLMPAEEITAGRILAAVYPEPNTESQTQVRLLLINALSEAFQMDWTALQTICHRAEYRVGEELAQMRLAAKKDVDAIGAAPDQMGRTPAFAPEESTEKARKASLAASEKALDDIVTRGY
jgi:hypothetical protein